MSTFQGIGTRFYGWNHQEGGTSHATQWFSLFFLPILPLKRYHLRVLTDFTRKEPFFVVPTEGFFAGSPTGMQVDEYQFIEQTPLVFSEVLRTVVTTYVFGPLLMAWPISLFFFLKWATDNYPSAKYSMWWFVVFVVLIAGSFGNAIAVPLIALRRTRGFRGGLFE